MAEIIQTVETQINPICEPIIFKHEYKDCPSSENEPQTSYSRCELITPDVHYYIPTRACIYYENKLFDFKSLENDENGNYDSQKFKNKATYFDNRVNDTSSETSISDAEKALNDFINKNNFTVIYGCRACCHGYRITKFCFDFVNDNVSIEQESCWGCDNFIDTYEIYNYSINDNITVFQLMVTTISEYMKNYRKYGCITAAYKGKIEWLQHYHTNGYPWDVWTSANAATNDDSECLEYCFFNGCEWDKKTCELAASNGKYKCLKFAIDNGCDIDIETVKFAAQSGNIECLKLAYETCGEWHNETTKEAARHGHIECLKFALDNGAPKHEKTCYYAKGNMKGLECYEYALANGCPE